MFCIYSLLQCGQPMETKNCIECGAQIGGANHRALPNNRVVDINDRYFYKLLALTCLWAWKLWTLGLMSYRQVVQHPYHNIDNPVK